MNKPALAMLALVMVGAIVLAFKPPSSLIRLMAKTDVVAIHAKRSYADLLASLPGDAPVTRTDGGWTFSAPDGSAAFFWNPSPAEANGGRVAELRTPAAPFLAAGLDPALLPEGVLRDGMLAFGADAERGGSAGGGAETPAAAFAAVVDACRDSIGYHFQLGHFGLDLDNGAVLEWAGELAENDLDLVFALDPEMFVRAGVDAERVDGWSPGTIIVHDASGRKVDARKLLKPFSLR